MQILPVTGARGAQFPLVAGNPNVDHPTKPAPDRGSKKTKAKPAKPPKKKK